MEKHAYISRARSGEHIPRIRIENGQGLNEIHAIEDGAIMNEYTLNDTTIQANKHWQQSHMSTDRGDSRGMHETRVKNGRR